jgi:hypothetical protein
MNAGKEVIVFSDAVLPPGASTPPGLAIQFRPPARAGDLLRCVALDPAAILLIDTIATRGPQPSYEEVRSVARSGIPFFGAGRMGAFWAADLADYGMRGLGVVHDLIRAGRLQDYHEVCVPPPGNGGGLALVEIRLLLDEAVESGALNPGEAPGIIETIASLPVPERTTRAIEGVVAAHVDQSCAEELNALLSSRSSGQCGIDAASALEAVCALINDGSAGERSALSVPAVSRSESLNRAAVELENKHRCFVRDGLAVPMKAVLDSYRLHSPGACDLHRAAVLAVLAAGETSGGRSLRGFAAVHGIAPGEPMLRHGGTVPVLSEELADDFDALILAWLMLRPHLGVDDPAIALLRREPDFEHLSKRQILVEDFNKGFGASADFDPQWLALDQLVAFYAALWRVSDEREFTQMLRLRGFRSREEFRGVASTHYLFDKLAGPPFAQAKP